MALLRTASRPVIVAGGGTIFSAAADPIRRFAEASGIPVVTNSKAHGLLPAEHGLYCGGTGVVGAATMTGNPPDVVIMAGARQGMYTGGRSGSVVPPGAKLIQIDLDATEIGRLRVADLAVIADCSETFSALTAAGEADGSNWPDYSAWVQTLVNLRAAGRAMFEDQPVEPRPGLLHPYHAAKAAMQALTADTTVVFDGGESGAWCDLHLRSAGPGRFMSNGYLGCLGCGPGMAIGAALARPDSRVAVFSGDGAAGFNIQEFDTMVRHALPILTVVLNNACWGMSQHGQDIVYGANRRSAVALAASRYDEVAAAFGAWGANVNRLEDIASAIEEAQAQAGPACINITTDPDIVHPVTPAMVGDVSAEDEIAIPYYENIPID